jgi:RimJ/RimL family protein N-acetyltransferase
MRAGEGTRLRELRLAALADAPSAFLATHEGDAARPLRHWEDLARGPGAVFIAGDFAGMAGIFIQDGRPHLWGMWVAPERRRAETGSALVRAALEWARVRGFDSLSLQVFDPGARAFYASLGFVGDEFMTHSLPREPRRIETERLVVREFVESDYPALRTFRSHEANLRWLYDDPPTEDEDRARLHRRIHDLRFALTGDALGFAVEAEGHVVADVSLMFTSAEDHQAELGYIAHPDFHGRGYTTEAAAALLRLAFDTFGLHRVAARLEARNVASARVCEKLGMRREAHLVENELVKGEWQSELIYAIRASPGA